MKLDDDRQMDFATGSRVLADASKDKEIDPGRCAYLASSLVELISKRRQMSPEEYLKLEETVRLLKKMSAEPVDQAEYEMPPSPICEQE